MYFVNKVLGFYFPYRLHSARVFTVLNVVVL